MVFPYMRSIFNVSVFGKKKKKNREKECTLKELKKDNLIVFFQK